MASQHNDPPRESVDEPSEVLSEATDLHALMEAILGDGIKAPDSVDAPAVILADLEPAVAAPPQPTVVASPPQPTVVASPREPTVVASPPPAKYPAERVVIAAIPDRDVDAWGFETEGPRNAREIASEMRLVRTPGEDGGVARTPRRTWRDRLRGSTSKRWMIVVGLLAGSLMTVSAISLRGDPTQARRRSFEAPGVMRSRPPVQPSSPVRPRISTEAEIRTPATKSDEVPKIAAPGANQRSNPATDDRTTPISVERRDVTAPLTWPIVMSADTLEGGAEASDGVSTPAQRLSGAAPEYPAALRSAGISGSVEVRFTIGSSGEVTDVRSTTGPPQLRSIAETAVRRWRYQAARVGDRPVETRTSVDFYFDPSAPQ